MSAGTQRIAVPPDAVLSARFGPVHFDEHDLRAVEHVIASFAAQHQDMADDLVAALRAGWREAAVHLVPAAVARCTALAHDLAGLGRTLGLPLATDLCRSLNRYLRLEPRILAMAREVVEIHLAALQVVAITRLADDGGTIGREIAAELSRAIRKFEAGRHADGSADA